MFVELTVARRARALRLAPGSQAFKGPGNFTIWQTTSMYQIYQR